MNFNCLSLCQCTNLGSVFNHQFSLNLQELEVFESCPICLKLKAIVVERQMVWSSKICFLVKIEANENQTRNAGFQFFLSYGLNSLLSYEKIL